MARERRYAFPLTPWTDVPQDDLQPAGEPEFTRWCRHERQVGLLVKGQRWHDPPVLGAVAIRCAMVNGKLKPMGLAWMDIPLIVDTEKHLHVEDGA